MRLWLCLEMMEGSREQRRVEPQALNMNILAVWRVSGIDWLLAGLSTIYRTLTILL